MRQLITMIALLGVWSSSAQAETATESFVLIVTSNQGSGLGRPDLQYADDDGAKYYEFFSMLAPEENIVLLTKFDRDTERLFPRLRNIVSDPTKQNVISASSRLAKRTKAALAKGKHVEFYFVFAGHGDVDHGRGFIELQDSSLGADALKKHILKGVPSTRTHVIADSCNSYFLIHARKPGGKRFATPADAVKKLAKQLPNVGVFLSTNAESEVYEWSELQSGIFSHAVRSGLAGAADANADNRVTYQELEAFVAIAVAEIRNPLYRPKVFSKAPKSQDTLANLKTAKSARIDLSGSTLRRIAVRDQHGIPWIDAHREDATPLQIHLPLAVAPGGWVEDLSVAGERVEVTARYPVPNPASERTALANLSAQPPSIDARGPGTMFHSLFRKPFGPKALAKYTEASESQPAPVFGISRQDAARMELLLSNIGDVEHRNRMMGTSGLIGVGALSLGAGAWLLTDDGRDDKTFGITLAALGGGTLIAGTIGLFKRTPIEKLREEFVTALARGDDPAAVVARTEKKLYDVAKDYRQTRLLMRWTGLGMAVAGASMFVLNELSDNPNDANRFSFGMLTAAASWASFSSLYEYPIEKMVSIWESDPGIQQLPRLSLRPLRDGAMVGLGGMF